MLPSRDVTAACCGLLRFLDVAFASFSRLAKQIAPATTVLRKKSCYPLQNVQIITLLFVSTLGLVTCINSTEYFNGKSSSYIYNLGGVRV